MAGLTKEQRAAREAEKAAAAPSPDLIRMTKDDESLDVHPSCVKDHERVGWVRA